MEETFGERISRLRNARGLSQTQAAELLGVNRSTISSYETDYHQPPFETLVKMSRLFHVTCDYLLGIENHQVIMAEGLTDKQYDAIAFLISELVNKK